MKSLKRMAVVAGMLLTASITQFAVLAADVTILSRDAVWKFSDTGMDLGTAWSGMKYDDSTWRRGRAPLGFGDDFSETDSNLPLATSVDFGKADSKHMTTYFRTTINVGELNDFKNLETYIHVDDGAVIYINGVEVFRRGIDNGVSVNFSTPAKFNRKEEIFNLPVNVLKEGLNVIAAEVHQDDGSSSDLWFEMGIRGIDSQAAVESSAPKQEPGSNTVNGPKGTVSKVTVTFNGDPTNSKGFTWYTTGASISSDLQVIEVNDNIYYNFDNALKFTGRASFSTNSKSEVVHKAEATKLKADTKYSYRVGDAALDMWSDIGSFRTAPKSGSFTFIDLADTQAKTEDEAILSAETIAKALNTVPDARFIAINGDLVDTGSNEGQWNWLLGHSQKSLMNTTFVPSSGNHDEQKNSFIEHFNLLPAVNSDTETGAYYSFDYCNAHFIVLNTNEDSREYADFTPDQIAWLKNDVKSAKAAGAKWVIVNMHKGPYTTSNHATDVDIMGSNGVRTEVAPILSDLGVDLVLQGHDHIYARSKPIKNGIATPTTKIIETKNGRSIEYTIKPDGTIYLIPSTAGPKVYYRNKKIDPSYYNLFEVADEHHAAVYGPDPSDTSRPVRSAIQNFVGITVDGDRLTAVSYEVDQNKNGAQPYIIDQFGIAK